MLSSIVPAPLARAVEPARCLTTIRLPGRPSPGICALLPAEADRCEGLCAQLHGSDSIGLFPGILWLLLACLRSLIPTLPLARRADDEGSSSAGSRDWLTLLAATAEGILYSFKLEATPEGSYKSFLQGEWFL